MRSLRSRIVLGTSLVAVVPLVLAMLLIARRIESMVRDQADARLTATTGGLEAQLVADGRRIGDQLERLAADPELRRRLLLRDVHELGVELGGRRVLLGLDRLAAYDAAGQAVADAAAAGTTAGASAAGADTARVAIVAADAHGTPALRARAPIHYQGAVAGTLVGELRLDHAFLTRVRDASGVELAILDASGSAVETTLDDAGDVPVLRAGTIARVRAAGNTYLARGVPLAIGAAPHATVVGLVPTLEADRTVAQLRVTAGLLGALGLALAIALALLWSAQVSKPVERLAAFSDRVARGAWDEPLDVPSVRELETLVAALERMRADLVGYRTRLVTSERHAAWGQMARVVAHEVRNPLTPIAISIEDLKRSQGRPDFPAILEQAVHTITQEIRTLQRLLHEFAEFGRMPEPRFAPCAAAALLDDLAALHAHEVAEGRLIVRRPAPEVTCEVDADQLRRALLNLIKNGFEAAGPSGHVTLGAARDSKAVRFEVADDGPGLTTEQRASLFTPGFSTKPQGSGLGLAIVERIVHDHGGSIAVESSAGHGATFRITVPARRTAPAA